MTQARHWHFKFCHSHAGPLVIDSVLRLGPVRLRDPGPATCQAAGAQAGAALANFKLSLKPERCRRTVTGVTVGGGRGGVHPPMPDSDSESPAETVMARPGPGGASR